MARVVRNNYCQAPRFALGILLIWIGATANPAQAAPHPFENEIIAFEKADQAHFPPTNAVLFVGSSSIRKWRTLAHDFPGIKVINRGFGGSQLSDSVYYFDRIVSPYKPALIVLYAGSNDLHTGKTPERVVADFEAFADKVSKDLPNARLDFISINASPSRWKDLPKVKEANDRIAAIISKKKNWQYIDTFTPMLDARGQSRPELYLTDRLHPNAKGYAIWRSVIAPYLDQAN